METTRRLEAGCHSAQCDTHSGTRPDVPGYVRARLRDHAEHRTHRIGAYACSLTLVPIRDGTYRGAVFGAAMVKEKGRLRAFSLPSPATGCACGSFHKGTLPTT